MNDDKEILSIMESVKKRHKVVQKTWGKFADRTVADRTLQAEKVASRIYQICDIMVKAGVIDNAQIHHEGKFKRICVLKNCYEGEVEIATNGIMIIASERSLSKYISPVVSPRIVFNTAAVDFNWEDFSNQLQNFIYKYIYEVDNMILAST